MAEFIAEEPILHQEWCGKRDLWIFSSGVATCANCRASFKASVQSQ